MKSATKQMIELALASDETVDDQIRHLVGNALEGRLPDRTTVDGPLLMNMAEAASYVGVSRTTFWRMVKEGIVQPVEIMSGIYRVRREDLVGISSQHAAYRPAQRGPQATDRASLDGRRTAKGAEQWQ